MIVILSVYDRACREIQFTEYFGQNNNTQAGLTEVSSLLLINLIWSFTV